MPAPPPRVLDAFGAGSDLTALGGGQVTAWRAGDLVFKPLDMSPAALEWQSGVLTSIPRAGFRVAAPLRSRTGALAVDGWTAWPALPGRQAPRWDEILAVGERFHAALAHIEHPGSVLTARTDAWARADRIAWGEEPAGDLAGVPEITRLLAARGPFSAPAQLVHGDLTGNVLFADGLAPAIIDFSPYWRPVDYASAVVIADAVLWHDAGLGLLARAADGSPGRELLIRGLLFRLLTHADPGAHVHAYRPAIDFITGRPHG